MYRLPVVGARDAQVLWAPCNSGHALLLRREKEVQVPYLPGTKEGAGSTTKEGAGSTTKDGAGSTTKDGAGSTTKDGAGSTTKEGAGSTPKEGAGSTTKEGAGSTTKEGAGSTPKEGAGSTPKEGAGSTTKEGAGSTPKEGAGSTTKEGAGSTTKEGAGSTTKEGAGSTTKEGAGSTTKEGAGSTPKEGAGSTTKEGAGSTTKEGAGSTTKEGAGSTTKEGAGSTTKEGAGSTTKEGAGSTTKEGAGSTTKEGAGSTTKEGAGATFREGAGDTFDEGAGSTSDEGAGVTSEEAPGAGQEVYLLNRERKKLFKAKCVPFKQGKERVVHFRTLNENEERFLISHVFHHNLGSDDEYDEDRQGKGTFIKWSLDCISVKNLTTCKPAVAPVVSSSTGGAVDYDVMVDIFWSDVHIGKGTVKSGISNNQLQDVVNVSMIYHENKNKVLHDAGNDIPCLSQIEVGKHVSWPTKEIQLSNPSGIQSKKRKVDSRKAKSENKREQKKQKKTEFDGHIQPCSCRDKCGDKVDNQTRVDIREYYWNIPQTGSDQNIFLSNFITRIPKKTHRVNAGDRKKFTVNYTLPISLPSISEDEKVTVCLKMFLNVIGIPEKKARIVTNKKYEQLPMNHGAVGKPSNNAQLPDSTKAQVIAHLNKFPSVPSHYRRKESSKRYFEADMTKAIMYRMVKEEHPDTKIHITTYSKIVKSLNIGFYKPKNDQCRPVRHMHNLQELQEGRRRYQNI